MALPLGDIRGLKVDVCDVKNSGLQLFTRPEIDVSLLHGDDVQVSIPNLVLFSSYSYLNISKFTFSFFSYPQMVV